MYTSFLVQFVDIAYRSAHKTAVILALLTDRRQIGKDEAYHGKPMLRPIVQMLVGLRNSLST